MLSRTGVNSSMYHIETISARLRNRKHCVRICSTAAASYPEAPSPKGLPFIGTLLSLLSAGGAPKLHEYVTMRHRQLGSIFKEKIGNIDIVFVSDPDDIQTVFRHEGKYPKHVYPEAWGIYNKEKKCQRGLFFMEDEQWLQLRRIMSNVMLKENNLNYLQIPCESVAKHTLDDWYETSKSSTEGIVPDLSNKLYKWSIEVLMATMMGSKYTPESKERLDPLVGNLAYVVQSVFDTTSQISLIPVKLAWKLNLPIWKQFENAMDIALSSSKKLAKELLDKCEGGGGGLLEQSLKQGLTHTDLIHINSDLLLAAGDTTAYTLHWILYALAKYPEVQAKLSDALENRVSSEIPWLFKGVLREVLRLYPVAPFLNRFMPEDTIIGGYYFPKGSLVVMSLYTTGRDEKFFQNPDKFWPERWLRNQDNRYLQAALPNASIPFAKGARSCIGKKIVEMQLYIMMISLIQNYHITLLNKKEIDIKLRLVAVPSEEVQISLVKKHSTH